MGILSRKFTPNYFIMPIQPKAKPAEAAGISDQYPSFKTASGQPFTIPSDGSLGLLALGYTGLMAWRQARREAVRQMKNSYPLSSSQPEK